MDAQTLANLVAFLNPFLPYLLKMGEKAVEEVGEQLGADAWDKAQALWAKLRGKEEVVAAAQELARHPDDADAQAALRWQLKKALEADETLAAEIARLMADEVIQRVIAEGGASIQEVEQQAHGGPTTQEVRASGEGSRIKGVRQIRR